MQYANDIYDRVRASRAQSYARSTGRELSTLSGRSYPSNSKRGAFYVAGVVLALLISTAILTSISSSEQPSAYDSQSFTSIKHMSGQDIARVKTPVRQFFLIPVHVSPTQNPADRNYGSDGNGFS